MQQLCNNQVKYVTLPDSTFYFPFHSLCFFCKENVIKKTSHFLIPSLLLGRYYQRAADRESMITLVKYDAGLDNSTKKYVNNDEEACNFTIK